MPIEALILGLLLFALNYLYAYALSSWIWPCCCDKHQCDHTAKFYLLAVLILILWLSTEWFSHLADALLYYLAHDPPSIATYLGIKLGAAAAVLKAIIDHGNQPTPCN